MMWRRVQRGWQLGPRLLTGTIFYVFRHFRLHCSIRAPRSEKTVARLGTGSETPCDLRTLTPRRLRSRLSGRQVQLLTQLGKASRSKRTAQHY